MGRPITPAVIAELGQDHFTMVDLLEIHFSPVIRISSSSQDIEWGGQTYTSDPNLLRLGDPVESTELRVGTTEFVFGGADQSYISLFLNENYIDKRVVYYKALLDPFGQVIPDPIVMFDGNVSLPRIDETTDTLQNSRVVLECASHWVNFEAIQGRRTNDTSHKKFFPNDQGMQYAAQSVKDIKWGAA